MLTETFSIVFQSRELLVTHNTEVQTDMHPIPTNIDHSYKWNIWDMKKKAVTLVNGLLCYL